MTDTRRQFLKSSLGVAAACSMPLFVIAEDSTSPPLITDTHIYLGHWPLQRLASETPEQIAEKLRSAGVTRAWAGNFEGLFHKDIAGVNQRLANICSQIGRGMFLPFGSINPMLPDWEDDIRRCHEIHHMPGVRLHPNYHGYAIDDPHFARLLALAGERGLVVQVVAWLETTRRFLLSPAPVEVDLAPLAAVIAKHPRTKLVVANGLSGADNAITNSLLSSSSVQFDLGHVSSVGNLRKLVAQFWQERLVVGSGAPLNDVERAVHTIRQAILDPQNLRAITMNNAAHVIENR